MYGPYIYTATAVPRRPGPAAKAGWNPGAPRKNAVVSPAHAGLFIGLPRNSRDYQLICSARKLLAFFARIRADRRLEVSMREAGRKAPLFRESIIGARFFSQVESSAVVCGGGNGRLICGGGLRIACNGEG